jgi:hypothetical protein
MTVRFRWRFCKTALLLIPVTRECSYPENRSARAAVYCLRSITRRSPGKIVLALLAVVSIFSWSIMITKLRVIRFARDRTRGSSLLFTKIDNRFVCLRKTRASGAPVFNVYLRRVRGDDLSSARLG